MSIQSLVRKRAREIWEHAGRPEGREQEFWDKAVKEIEAEGSEDTRGPVHPGPAVGGESAPSIQKEEGGKGGCG